MVGTGSAPAPPVVLGTGVRAVTLRALAAVDRAYPVHLNEHLLILVTAGHGTLAVDFQTRHCRPGTLMWCRPGQVIAYGPQPALDAVLLGWDVDLFRSLRIGVPAPVDPCVAAHWQLAGEDGDAIVNEITQLVADAHRYRADGLPPELLGHQLAVLLLRLAVVPPVATGADGTGSATRGIYQQFRTEVERSYLLTRRVEDYAARLGCSVRTLTRACLAVAGRSAKQVIDDRATLEARRLLAGTQLPVAEIGARLGFVEPTNFGRFFHREVGCSPGAFRATLREAPATESRAADSDRSVDVDRSADARPAAGEPGVLP